jgi:hypothetical protein
VKTPEYFNVVIASEKMHVTGRHWLRNVVTIAFIALVALCLTAPVRQSHSVFEAPLPMPAALWVG